MKVFSFRSRTLRTVFVAIVLLGAGCGDGTTSGGAPDIFAEEEFDSVFFEARVKSDVVDLPDVLRVWIESHERQRWEASYSAAADDRPARLYVADGDHSWFYDGDSHAYYTEDLDSAFVRGHLHPGFGAPQTVVPWSDPAGPMYLGPAQLEAKTRNAENRWQEREEREEVAGRTARVLEIQTPRERETYWFDEAFIFILRRHVEVDGRLIFDMEIIDVVFNEPLEEAVLAFEPPAGATQAEPPPGERPMPCGTAARVVLPEGYLRPAYLPQGFEVSGCTSPPPARVSLSHPGGGDVTIIQWADPYDDVRLDVLRGDTVDIAGKPGFFLQDGPRQHLAWETDEHLIVIETRTLPLDELLRIAESMQ